MPVLQQVCKLIPSGLVKTLAAQHKVQGKSRTFSPWSHVVSLLYAQLCHCIGLNDTCDGLAHHKLKLATVRGATPPSRNGLSHANKNRNSDMMESLFWKTLAHLQDTFKQFGPSGGYSKLPRRFKRTIHVLDSSVIALVANCMDWAKHRRRKAAAKLHMRLNLQTFLPGFAVVEEASHHDGKRMPDLAAGLKEGEIVIFDKAYVYFSYLFELTTRGVFWVTRAKDNMVYHVCKKRQKGRHGNILKDEEVTLKTKKSKGQYPRRLRRVEAEVEVQGKKVVMVFLTNNFDWSAQSICDLYASRWGIEAFFKQIKQTLQVCDFLGHSKHAIRWQLWSALLLYVLLRFLKWACGWPHSFIRLFTTVRGVIWDRFDIYELLRFYGTADGRYRMRVQADTAYLPGIAP